jgi:hypothetical protein
MSFFFFLMIITKIPSCRQMSVEQCPRICFTANFYGIELDGIYLSIHFIFFTP